ncbi:MAG: hypothetical protein GX895_10705 [Clostridiales bacterium]|uniref:hypothetical protein n=1 Tax=Clostridium sp. N3C TaxID=1776758 RepID=UPI00092E0D52|nr:hypothetical protein [Clostridium sp. N3C]NLZ49224.1 hypothetical protein [Clostridiales bacterium]SCN22393.1 hypothetical protein N3C_0746 [Clostridium sp. N3C]
MAKPSIFSSEYEKKMRARKRRRVIIVLCLVIGGAYFLFTSTYNKWQKQHVSELEKKQEESGYLSNKDSSDKKNKDKDKIDDTKKKETIVEDKVMKLTLDNNKTYQIIYTESDNKKVIKNLIAEDNSIFSFNINPDGSKVVILDENQDLYVADLEGNKKNITKPEYITTKGKVIPKAQQLQYHPDFIWHSSPKFINNDTIVYISHLPFFNTKLTVYKVNIDNGTHDRILPYYGKEVNFENLEEKGLKVNIDGVVRYISSDGKFVE